MTIKHAMFREKGVLLTRLRPPSISLRGTVFPRRALICGGPRPGACSHRPLVILAAAPGEGCDPVLQMKGQRPRGGRSLARAMVLQGQDGNLTLGC